MTEVEGWNNLKIIHVIAIHAKIYEIAQDFFFQGDPVTTTKKKNPSFSPRLFEVDICLYVEGIVLTILLLDFIR